MSNWQSVDIEFPDGYEQDEDKHVVVIPDLFCGKPHVTVTIGLKRADPMPAVKECVRAAIKLASQIAPGMQINPQFNHTELNAVVRAAERAKAAGFE